MSQSGGIWDGPLGVLALIPSLVLGCLCSGVAQGSWVCYVQWCLLCLIGASL